MNLIQKRMKTQNMFCFWSQVFFQLVKFAVEKWPTPGTKSGVFRYLIFEELSYYLRGDLSQEILRSKSG